MDTLQAAVVLAKLERFDWEVEQRKVIGQHYNELMDKAGIERVQQRKDRTSVFAQYTIFTDKRQAVQEKLKDAGIPTAVHYPAPLNEQSAYKQIGMGNTPFSKEKSKQVISLPMSPDLTADDQQVVVRELAV